jgi:hypothetical protein
MLTYRALEAEHGGVAVLPFTRMHVEYELAHKAPCIAFQAVSQVDQYRTN